MKEILRMVKWMDMEFLDGQKDKFTEENIIKTKNTEKELWNGKTE